MTIKLDAGENLHRSPNEPIISLEHVGDDQPYLWIGNNADADKFCFATLSGRARLEKLAQDILTALKNVKGRP